MNPFLIILLTLTVSSAQLLRPRLNNPVPSEVDVMYEQGLNYLLSSQSPDGTWTVNNVEGQPAIVAFAMMAVMAKGENLSSTKYKNFIKNCLDDIFESQNKQNGFIGTNMYHHGFTTLALTEVYGLVDDERIGPALKVAVDLILESQKTNPTKAWRYSPGSNDADTTVTGCQLVALLGARNAGIPVPDEAINQGLAFLEKCRTREGAYGYTNNSNGRPTLTAIGVLSHHLSQKKSNEAIDKSITYLTRRLNYRDQQHPFYFEYYMSQALFQADEKTWADWNKKNIRYLKLVQGADGSWKGSPSKVYATSAALLSLAVNYRLLPIYEKF